MSTPGAIQHLVEHIKSMHPNFFARNVSYANSQTTYNDVVLTISNRGYSSATSQKALHFLVNLGAYQPGDNEEAVYSVWVNDPKEDNPRANQAAVIAALDSLVENGTWNTTPIISMTA